MALVPGTVLWALAPLLALAGTDPDRGWDTRGAPTGSAVTVATASATPQVPKNVAPDTMVLVCVLTAAFVAVAIMVVFCFHCGRRCWGRAARAAGAADGGAAEAAGAAGAAAAALPPGDPKTPSA